MQARLHLSIPSRERSELGYRGEAHIRQRDFGIQPIRIAGGTISVKDDLRIAFDIAPASGLRDDRVDGEAR